MTRGVFVGLTCIALVWGCERETAEVTSTQSPQRTYDVQFRQHRRNEEFETTFQVKRSGVVLEKGTLYKGSDPLFSEYPTQQWTSESVLAFHSQRSPHASGIVTLRNLSSHVIESIILESGQLTLVLDMPSGKSVDINIDVIPHDLFIECRAKSSKAQGLYASRRFIEPVAGASSLLHFCVSVTDQEIGIASVELEGIRQDPGRKLERFPPASTCR